MNFVFLKGYTKRKSFCFAWRLLFPRSSHPIHPIRFFYMVSPTEKINLYLISGLKPVHKNSPDYDNSDYDLLIVRKYIEQGQAITQSSDKHGP